MATRENFNNSLFFPNFELGTGDMMNSVGIRRIKYVSRFDNFLIAMNINNEQRKRALLLHFGGFDLQDIYDSVEKTGDTYEQLTQTFTSYFEPKTNSSFEIFNFQKTLQEEGESIQAYHLRLREMASRCDFVDVNKHIKTQLILGTTSIKLQKFCFAIKDATVQDILTRGKLLQDIDYQTKVIDTNGDVKIKSEPEDIQAVLKEELNKIKEGKKFYYSLPPRKQQSCFNCGNEWPHQVACPAKNKTCKNCGKINHFARVCRSKRNSTATGVTRPLNFVYEELDDNNLQYFFRNSIPQTSQRSSIDSCQDTKLFSIHVVTNYIQGVSQKLQKFTTRIKIEGQLIDCLIDTGCSTNILNYNTFQNILKSKQPALKRLQIQLVTYGANEQTTNLHTLGTVQCLAESDKNFAADDFFVVDTKAINLIGGNLALKLNLLTLNINNISANTHEGDLIQNKCETHDLKTDNKNRPEIVKNVINEFQHVFHGIGCFKGDKIKLHINKNIQPVAQKPRRIPFHLRPKLKKNSSK